MQITPVVLLRVVLLVALLPVLAAGEEGPVVSGEAPAAEAPAVEAPAAEAPAEEASAEEAKEPVDYPSPREPTRDWTQVVNPRPGDSASIDQGRALYLKEGLCFLCHGEEGDGNGPARGQLSPDPNAFFEDDWQDSFSDGELMGFLYDGKFGTGMIPIVPDFLTEDQGWDVVNFVRSLRGKTTPDYEAYKAGLKKKGAGGDEKSEESTE